MNNEDGTFKLCKTFEEYVEQVKFKPMFCKPYDSESKGKIAAVVKYFKFNFANHRTYKGIKNLNAAFHRWLERIGNTKIHQTTKKVPSEVFSLERQYLRQVDKGISELKAEIFRQFKYNEK